MRCRALSFAEASFASLLSLRHRFLRRETTCTYLSTWRSLGFGHRPFLAPLGSIRTLPLRHHIHAGNFATSSFRMVAKAKGTADASPGNKDVEAMLQKGKLIMEKLEEVYPEAPEGFLNHSDSFTLLVAVVLSAQSLDIKVNEITPELFRLGGTPEKMRELGEAKIREIIKQIGLAPQKAKNIAKLSADICDKFGGQVPDTFGDLESLAGVGHKTASVVMMQAFGKPAFPVDTHIHRLACRWGCGDAKSVVKTENSLKEWFPDAQTWGELHTRIILFGREYCPARNHDMDECPICSFAATDESWNNNRLFPKKFTAPVSHKIPYSIRDITALPKKVDVDNEDADYPPQQASKKKRSRGKTAPKATKGVTVGSEVRKSGRRKIPVSYVEPGQEDAPAALEITASETEEPKQRGRKVKKSPPAKDSTEQPKVAKRSRPSRQATRTKATLVDGSEVQNSSKKRRTSSRRKE